MFRARGVAALLAVLAVLGVTISVVVDTTPDQPGSQPVVVTVELGGPNPAGADTVRVGPTGRAELRRATTPTEQPGEPERELDNPLREPDDPSRTPAGVLEGPLAAQEFPGCRTRFVGNYSSRNGATPRVIVWHQTVSRERGQASQDALTAYANRRSSGVSWHFLIGRTNGLCTFSVPLNMKAWTQGNANPFSFGIEVEAYGDEPSYVSGAGRAKLLAVTRELGRRFNIPMRRGLVRNCQVVRSGIVEHSDLGACGGGHADVTPWSTGALVDELARTAAAPTAARGFYTARERELITEYDRLKRADQDVDRRRVLRRAMCEQRKRVWRAAQVKGSGGFESANRRARYRSLAARSDRTCR